jgi:predicted hotdog family 3-hydroxylacyl-ACP dehydratase
MNNYSIDAVLPHSDPMILLDELISYNEDGGQCGVTISPQAPFYNAETQTVASYIGTEYMAQSIAAYAGALALDNGDAVKIGFLIGTRKYQTYVSEFKLGQTLRVSVTKLYQEESGLSVFDCRIEDGSELLAEAKLNVFQPHDPVQFIKEQ